MKITVKHLDTEIIIDESDNGHEEKRKTSIRWKEENEQVLKTLTEMINKVKELH